MPAAEHAGSPGIAFQRTTGYATTSSRATADIEAFRGERLAGTGRGTGRGAVAAGVETVEGRGLGKRQREGLVKDS